MTKSSMRSLTFGTLPSGYESATHALEAVFEFNGLVINDRRRIDCYRLSAITGLDDADVRDTREVNPDHDGETPFAALYGGRTVTLTGQIEAGNLEYLRYMQQNLKAAFDDISTERDLLIRWYDWYDDFKADSLAIWKQDYLSDINAGAEGITLSGNAIVPSTTLFRFLSTARRYEDYQNTLKFHTGASTASSTVWLFAKWQDSANHMEARLTATTLAIYQYSPSNSGTNPAPAVSYTLLANTDYWLRLQQDGIYIKAALFTSDPDTGAAAVAQTTVGASENGQMGVGAVGMGGFGAQIGAPTGWLFDALDLRGANPGDMIVRCKKVAKMEGTEGWTGFNYRLPFMVTLRASSPRKLSRVESALPQVSGTKQLQSSQLTFPIDGSGIPFDSSGGITFGFSFGAAVNRGLVPTYPSVRLIGPLIDAAVVNLSNGSRITTNGTINTGEYIDIDCDARTVRDNSGRNRYDLLGVDNTWLALDPGSNALTAGVVTTISAPVTILDTNQAPNPSAETGQANWTRVSVNNAFPVSSGVMAKYGVFSFEIAGTSAFPNAGMWHISNVIPATVGLTYSLAAEFRAAAAASGRSCNVTLAWYNSGGTFISATAGSSVTDTTTGWTRATHTAVAPATTAFVQPRITIVIPVTNEKHYIDGVILSQAASAPAYFDGDFPSCIWEGVAHGSRSLKISTTAEIVPGSAVVTWRNAFR